jgi:hypothetical protein
MFLISEKGSGAVMLSLPDRVCAFVVFADTMNLPHMHFSVLKSTNQKKVYIR